MKNNKKLHSIKSETSNCLFILRLVWRLNKSFYFIKIPTLLIGVSTSFLPLFFHRMLLNEIQFSKRLNMIVIYTLGYAAALLVISIANNLLGIVLERQTKKTGYMANEYLGNVVMNIPYSELEMPRTKDFIKKAESGNTFLDIINNLFSLISSVITLAGLTAIIVTIQPAIILMILFVIIVRTIVERRNRKVYDKYRSIFAPIMRKVGYLFGIMQSPAYGKEIRVNSLQSYIYDKTLDVGVNEYLRTNKTQVKELTFSESLLRFAMIAQECLIYFILTYKVVFSGMPIGDFVMYLQGILNFSGCTQGIISSVSGLRKSGDFAEDLRYCIEMSRNCDDSEKVKIPNVETVSLEFRNVSFMYPNTERMILKNISFSIWSGESLSLVGINGAGKTTLVKLICRLYKPTEGEILINGYNIYDIPDEQYKRILGVVFQDFKIFAFSAAENIALDTTFDKSKIELSIEKSDIKGKIDALPKGIDTSLSKMFDEEGIELSGGEQQKLAIARTLYKDPPMIILDEPTSALDPIAEYEIYQKLHELIKGCTAVYISHRLSSTRFTDKIAVLEEGELKEYGNHKELMKIETGIYKNMFEMQAKYYV